MRVSFHSDSMDGRSPSRRTPFQPTPRTICLGDGKSPVTSQPRLVAPQTSRLFNGLSKQLQYMEQQCRGLPLRVTNNRTQPCCARNGCPNSRTSAVLRFAHSSYWARNASASHGADRSPSPVHVSAPRRGMCHRSEHGGAVGRQPAKPR